MLLKKKPSIKSNAQHVKMMVHGSTQGQHKTATLFETNFRDCLVW